MTAEGKLCSEKGDFVVNDRKTCHEAANELRYDLQEWEDMPDWPNGCFAAKVTFTAPYTVFFNKHTSGSRNNKARQICKPRGKE